MKLLKNHKVLGIGLTVILILLYFFVLNNKVSMERIKIAELELQLAESQKDRCSDSLHILDSLKTED